ncbi:MAG: hypothetical protein KR126chlam4_00698 [Candidatus Anoxychlamydiales bacterium]|nr:hypothetical protein [Candidatus Anoxychlamydiales bacterium]NGX40867.1 hypothetical protein [Candidatus Anoxychlamydiales bacterium]
MAVSLIAVGIFTLNYGLIAIGSIAGGSVGLLAGYNIHKYIKERKESDENDPIINSKSI